MSFDRISNLPTDIIDDILSRIPLRDAGKTSVLSKKWRYMWSNTPSLVFDHEFGIIPAEFSYPGDKTNKILSDIFQILSLHPGPLRKFTLCVGDLRPSPLIDQIMLNLSETGVENLEFSCKKYEIPSYLFSMLLLRTLSLEKCHFLPAPISFEGFTRLTYLELKCVRLNTILDDFILKCSLLSGLKVHNCWLDSESLELDAPNLKFFSFKGTFWGISFRNTPILEEVVNLPRCGSLLKFVRGNGSIFSKVLSQLSLVKSLSVSHRYLEYLAIGGLPYRYPTILKFLKFEKLDFEDKYAISSVLCLIRSSPNLEELRFEAWPGSHYPNPDDREVEMQSNPDSFIAINTTAELLEAQIIRSYVSNKIRYIELLYLTGSKSQMEFVKFMLGITPHLEKMVISTFNADSSEEFDRFPRASPEAEVLVNVLSPDGHMLSCFFENE